MRNLLYFFILFFPAVIFGQVVKTAAVPYTKGAGYTPNIASSSELRVDTAASALYWWDRDALTWMRFRPGVDVITGSSAPAYTPRDNQSLFAVNADGELYYYNSPSWVQIGGAGGGGIYGGSGSVADGTVATLTDDFEFSGGDISSFTVSTGTTNGGQLFSNLSGATVIQRDTSNNYLELTNTGANFNFGGSFDRLTITGRDVRYAADYSGTFSARSLIDKGYADGAYISDADWTTGFSSATQATSSWTATNAGSNVNAAIVPKGTGGVIAAVPDGSATGGNARGTNAVDLQTNRNANTQVASGTSSVVAGGARNTASAQYSSVLGGYTCTASGAGSVAMGGNSGFGSGVTASGTSSFAFGTGASATAQGAVAFNGDATAQGAVAFNASATHYNEFSANGMSHLSLSELTLGTGAQELFLDGNGGSLRATIGSDNTWVCEVRVLARVVSPGGGTVAARDIYAATYKCVIANKSGTTALVGTVQADMAAQFDANMATASFTIAADDTNDALTVTYNPGALEDGTTQVGVYATIWMNEF